MPSPDRLDIVPEHVADPVRRPPWRVRFMRGSGDLVLSLALNGAVVGWLAGIGFPLRAIEAPAAISVELVDRMPGDAGSGGSRPGNKSADATTTAPTKTAEAAEPAPAGAGKAAPAEPSGPPPPTPAPQQASEPTAQPPDAPPPDAPPPGASDVVSPPAAKPQDAGPLPDPKPDPVAAPPPPEHPDHDPRARLVEAPMAAPPLFESKPEPQPATAAHPAEQQAHVAEIPGPPGDDAGQPPAQPPVQSAAAGDEAVPPPSPHPDAPKPLTAEEKRQAENTATLAAMLPFGSSIAGSPFQAQANGQGTSTAYRGQVYAKFNEAQDVIADARAKHLKGQAVVAFTVDDHGGLASIGIAVSSRNPAVDRAALELIRRAAPFPPPPPGAQRTFSPAIGLGLDE